MPLLDFQPRRKPIISTLSTRPTFILREPLVRKLGLNPLLGFRSQAVLPPGVTEEQAIKVVQEAWGKKLAAGIADRARMTGAERERFIESWSRVVAEGLMRGA